MSVRGNNVVAALCHDRLTTSVAYRLGVNVSGAERGTRNVEHEFRVLYTLHVQSIGKLNLYHFKLAAIWHLVSFPSPETTDLGQTLRQ